MKLKGIAMRYADGSAAKSTEDLGPVPGIHVAYLATACKSSSGESDIIGWMLNIPPCTCTHIYTNLYAQYIFDMLHLF